MNNYLTLCFGLLAFLATTGCESESDILTTKSKLCNGAAGGAFTGGIYGRDNDVYVDCIINAVGNSLSGISMSIAHDRILNRKIEECRYMRSGRSSIGIRTNPVYEPGKEDCIISAVGADMAITYSGPATAPTSYTLSDIVGLLEKKIELCENEFSEENIDRCKMAVLGASMTLPLLPEAGK